MKAPQDAEFLKKMMQVQTLAPGTKDILEGSGQFCFDLLGYCPEQTALQIVQEKDWGVFSQQRGLRPNSQGVYLPRNQTAVIRGEVPLSLFHEYFGHGLYCEQSLQGRKLVDLERGLMEEEEREFKGRSFSLEEVQKFRQQNETFQRLMRFREEHLAGYEFFAIWMEYLLSGQFDLREDFEERFSFLDGSVQERVQKRIQFNEQYGDLATFYASGLARRTTPERARKLLEGIYGDKLKDARLVLLYGSGKEFSDVDVFVISDEIGPFYCDWLDVRAYEPGEVDERLRHFDSRLTDPIRIGQLVAGDQNYLDHLKKMIEDTPITQEAVEYNLKMAAQEEERSRDASLGKHLQEKNLRSSKTYLTNAISLSAGRKILTFEGLVEHSRVLSRSGRFKELKGGIE